MIPEIIPDYLNHEKSLEERLKSIDSAIDETKERMKKRPKAGFPKTYELYRQRLHHYELIKDQLREALFEEITKR